jgi:hypothetical protein
MPPPPHSPKEPSPTSSNNKPNASEPSRIVPTVVPAAPFRTSRAPGNGPEAPLPRTSRSLTAPPVGGIFFPQRPLLRLNNHAYSPAAWRQIADAAAYFGSFADAAHSLNHQAKLSITPQHVHTLAQEVGEEMQQQRDAKAAKGRRQLPVRVAQTPELVAVEVDGGRLALPAEGPNSLSLAAIIDRLSRKAVYGLRSHAPRGNARPAARFIPRPRSHAPRGNARPAARFIPRPRSHAPRGNARPAALRRDRRLFPSQHRFDLLFSSSH